MTDADSYNLETGQSGLTGSCASPTPEQQQRAFETGGAFLSPCPAYTPSTTPPGGPGPVLGCTDPTATNYNPLATFEDGSCLYSSGPPLPNTLDFAVLRYQWGVGDGTDLDTRTAVQNPGLLNDVGWNRNVTDPVTGILPACSVSPAPADTSPYYLVHGGDNCQQGVEAVLINFKKLAADYPGQASFTIRLRAFWFGLGYDPSATPPRDGITTLQFQTYLGGTMSHVGYDFTNSGGMVRDTVSVPRQLYTNLVEADVDGDNLATLIYNPATKLATIVPAPPPPMPATSPDGASIVNSRASLTARSPATKP